MMTLMIMIMINMIMIMMLVNMFKMMIMTLVKMLVKMFKMMIMMLVNMFKMMIMMSVKRWEVKRCKKCKTDGVDDILEAVRQPRLRFKYLQTASEDQPRLVSDHHRVQFQILTSN